jgi:hypothetical protein
MAIGVNRNLDGVMPHLSFHIRQGLAMLDEKTGIGMSQVVQTNMSKLGFLEKLCLEMSSEFGRREDGPFLGIQ